MDVMRNVFLRPDVAARYDAYYLTDQGRLIDRLEKQLIDELLSDMPVVDMLELGCGTGHWTEHFEAKGFSLTALDVSAAMLKESEKRRLKATFIQADASYLPFPDEYFDVVSAITFLEFTEDPYLVIREIFRVLKPEGCFVGGFLNADSVLGLTKASDETFRNARFYTADDLLSLFTPMGSVRLLKGVYMDNDFGIFETGTERGIAPAFLAVKVKRNPEW